MKKMKLVKVLWGLCMSAFFLVACGEDNSICNPLPVLTTGTASSITEMSAIVTGNIIAPECGEPLISQGFVYAITEFPKNTDSIVEVSGEEISTEVTSLKQNTTYYYRTYFTNATETYYGDQKSFTTEVGLPIIGQERDGGIVFYIAEEPTDLDGDGVLDTGLVCATEDQSAYTVRWYNGSFIATGATASGLGSGATNTATIIEAQGEGSYAASVASNYDGGGFNDWFLPSRAELNLMYTNLKVEGLGNFQENHYWSASESRSNTAWKQSFIDGTATPNQLKSSSNRVRAVRAF
jgi:hypothetical protein